MTTAIVLGTRPELIKMAPVLFALEEIGEEVILIHSGQHYDDALSESFIRDLGMRKPDHYLQVGSGTQAAQTADCMYKLEKVLEEKRPDSVLVQGDTNTVLAGALTAVKMGIKVGHVEAGLRSNDRRMPEEYNRRIADHISHYLFAPTPDSASILKDEKVWGDIHMTGNTVIDACERYVKLAEEKSQVAKKIPFEDYILVTAHRAENVDDQAVLTGLVDVLDKAPLPIVYPLHPRTKKMLGQFGLYDKLAGSENVHLIPPAGYFDFLAMMKRCSFIFSDSGGIQEEATSPSIRKRVLVFRKSTERPEAIDAGYATMIGTDAGDIAQAIANEVSAGQAPSVPSPYGDGNAGKNIARIVAEART
ncbi:MAG: UDP-N-acetylglucosamine 2-epimerase (non-hydrolyzing) [Thermoplasmata archaeon]|nr:UDP-N-acetylglucosamine 2-epimerase (non-hydrolyzing) [Thermoplasmata archaeon]